MFVEFHSIQCFVVMQHFFQGAYIHYLHTVVKCFKTTAKIRDFTDDLFKRIKFQLLYKIFF